MTVAFVVGNGISRQAVDLNKLKQFGSIYGCNALYREFVPDVLVSTDTPIATEIQSTGYALANAMYTRNPVSGQGAQTLPKKCFGYSSGPAAMYLAANDGHNVIYLLGFDMGSTEQGLFNNVYADSQFYRKSSDPPTYVGNWVTQMVSVMREFPATSFIRVAGQTTAPIVQFDNMPNLLHVYTKQFIHNLDTGQI